MDEARAALKAFLGLVPNATVASMKAQLPLKRAERVGARRQVLCSLIRHGHSMRLREGGQSPHRLGRPRIALLIVDDNRDMRELYEEYFVAKAFDVETAIDGRDGEQRAVRSLPNIVVTDLSMPHLDGWAMIRRLKADARTAHIPIIACTGQVLDASAERALDAGCDAYVVKPCLPEDLLREIRRMLARHSARGTA